MGSPQAPALPGSRWAPAWHPWAAHGLLVGLMPGSWYQVDAPVVPRHSASQALLAYVVSRLQQQPRPPQGALPNGRPWAAQPSP
ncbi:hypothetical protein PCASD_11757 [Puccinia coronata f. sp. avenae]|uniref:Uncharacterized protein n=1 Tax=Puccinia coronata f. sp. avenae TaxID=200324 RepID=A0A2N5UQM8_9BASI|nr:hypothetical protein PCASD_11757 [Puccinia coronata f. sp. avenae]